MNEPIKPAPIVAVDGPAPFVRVTLKARGAELGGTKVLVRRRIHRFQWRIKSILEGSWT